MTTEAPQQQEIIEVPDQGQGNQTLVFGLIVAIVLAVAAYFILGKKSTTGPPPGVKPTAPAKTAAVTPIQGAEQAAIGALTSPGFFSGLLSLGTQIAKLVPPSTSTGGGGGSSYSGGGLPAYDPTSAGLPVYNPTSDSGASYGPPSPDNSGATYGPPSP